ncbi:hypothetical protein PP175_17635 [Aneurinibacillus sp. Ricciae_BoGa-3]|uniref:hypothetical protein n=1 Tax=Aneurinibacillus sp. Ricciae_BoGa-3 TaxID=3022697 RepID=UPI0023415A29|nr:hypothetical protein [Aneurinibacillus sp. Ricciae_BoGa-3]WCK53214.1 hypothetical protein PP175_17635 [Aneurinibacillus sp. Ricciae_BoGa-3]
MNKWIEQLKYGATRLFKKKISITVVAVLLLLCLISAVVWKMTTPKSYMGTWIWNASVLENQQQDILHFASQNRITHLYVWVNAANAQKETYQKFIEAASSNHIKVEALAGDPSWATLKAQKNIRQFLNWVKDYNASVNPQSRFSGVHLDIEPYLLPDWKTNQQPIVKEWMSNIVMISQTMRGSLPGLTSTADLPFWVNALKTPDAKENLSTWIMKRFDHISIMAYRDKGVGPDSIYELSNPLIQEANGLNKSVIIDVQINPVKEGSNTTFNKKGAVEMRRQMNKVQDKFYYSSALLGFAVHDYSAWRASDNVR